MIDRRQFFHSPAAIAVVLLLLAGYVCQPATAVAQVQSEGMRSLADRNVRWPSLEQVKRTLLLRDYNTRIVVIGTTLLGMASGLVGSFMLLRKRALLGDALSHATLPGIALAFILATISGGNGKALPVLLAGAAATGTLGVATILLIRNTTRIKEDAALGIVLSVFFGAGISLLRLAQDLPEGNAAGLEGFIYGKTASLTIEDARWIGIVGLLAVTVCSLFFKEFKLLCFDETFAASSGQPVRWFDMLLMSQVVLVTIIGLQAVGLVLMIALLVIPAAAARFWTERMVLMTVCSAAIGAVSAMSGAAVSALFPRLPSGAMIVLVSVFFFLLSMMLGPARGLVVRAYKRWELEHRIRTQHVLRAIFELLESLGIAPAPDARNLTPAVELSSILPMRSWSHRQLSRLVRRCESAGLLVIEPDGKLRLTPRGVREAARLVRQHRLWELYLIHFADVATSQVDRGADAIEHVLNAEMVAELEALLQKRPKRSIPTSPHPVLEE